ncbi:MAG TPA: pyridoxamine 5'-phosphate oxidase family protein [Hydrogenophaga sp.]|uniref:pyridoxamine 5'-phosphate oxidase family protein n=1 Tax=Hydrogenophaga sp. TaxID=1904254 RepID=UPI002BCF34F2|nr:pyridoxamine 5'-phosphate oxidase family protein [Hydrogenophaga sp.]HSX93174.1 pyridoxamine 5'-phosphate oxidase family protein [Hydrogenophaga sp.]
MHDTATFHDGERAMQARAGALERLTAIGPRVVRDHMPDQHRELFEKLPTLVVGSLDAAGQPWASLLAGPPGFVRTPDARHLRVNARPDADDPLAPALALGAPLGLLGLEPHTRRRNRMNGRVVDDGAEGFTVRVDQSFGNCPQYIQAREPEWVPHAPLPAQRHGARLIEPARALLARADTVFIASAAPRAGSGSGGEEPSQGVDVSHRGGLPGFVRVHDDEGPQGASVLTLPDYRGNFFFNTLGNLLARPQAGLLCVDPGSGDVLQLAAEASLVWDGPELAATPGAERLLRLRVVSHLWRPGALPLRWTAPQFAPQFLHPARG